MHRDRDPQAELGEMAQGDAHRRVLFLIGALLFVATFVIDRAGAITIDRLHWRLTPEDAWRHTRRDWILAGLTDLASCSSSR